jgi:hypothetical protein
LLFGQFTCGADQRGLLVFGVFLEHGFIILKFFAFVPFCSEVIYRKQKIIMCIGTDGSSFFVRRANMGIIGKIFGFVFGLIGSIFGLVVGLIGGIIGLVAGLLGTALGIVVLVLLGLLLLPLLIIIF